MDSRHLCTLSPSAREYEGATKYLHLHVFWHWLSPQKHTPAYPGAPFPLKYESFFCSLLLTETLDWNGYYTLPLNVIILLFFSDLCNEAVETETPPQNFIGFLWPGKKINKQANNNNKNKKHNSFSAWRNMKVYTASLLCSVHCFWEDWEKETSTEMSPDEKTCCKLWGDSDENDVDPTKPVGPIQMGIEVENPSSC